MDWGGVVPTAPQIRGLLDVFDQVPDEAMVNRTFLLRTIYEQFALVQQADDDLEPLLERALVYGWLYGRDVGRDLFRCLNRPDPYCPCDGGRCAEVTRGPVCRAHQSAMDNRTCIVCSAAPALHASLPPDIVALVIGGQSYALVDADPRHPEAARVVHRLLAAASLIF